MDETTLSLDPPLRARWMKIGQQRRIPATQAGTKQKRHIFGGYNGMSDQITWTTAETKNSAQFIYFLEQLQVKKYPTGRVVLVMDNASYHKSASALAALSWFEHRVMVVWLPPYCSDLNPIERFRRQLKDRACANMLQDTIQAVLDNAEQALIDQNQLSKFRVFVFQKTYDGLLSITAQSRYCWASFGWKTPSNSAFSRMFCQKNQPKVAQVV